VTDAAQWVALAAARFDYCLDFSRTDRSAFLTLLSGANQRITYDTIRREPLRQLSYNEFIPSRVRFLHTIDHHLSLLAPLGVHDPSGTIRLALPPNARALAAAIIAEQSLGENFVMIHPGSARAEKFWVARRWAEIAQELEDEAMPVVLTGGTSRMEKQHIARIKSHLRKPVIDLSGKLDLLTLSALIERARLLLTIDSAPMHLAGALGTPQVALFGPTNPFHWHPRGAPAVVLRAGQPEPLTIFLPQQEPRPMKEISTKQVIDAMRSLLSTPAVQAS
jgi:predicted lipopolysaccharide heptosyltransferase III